MTSFPVPSIYGLACAFAFTLCHACMQFLWGIQCEDTLLEPSQVCQTQMIFGIGRDTIDVDFMVGFWMGGVDQRIFGLSTASPLGKPKDNPP